MSGTRASPPAKTTAERSVSAPRFPARKTLEDFDYSFQRSSQPRSGRGPRYLYFIAERNQNIVFLGPPGTGKTHLATGIGIRACQAGHRVGLPPQPSHSPASPTVTPKAASNETSPDSGRVPLLIIDEVGYIPFEADAANLFFQLVSSRYERASLIVTSNKPFGRWGEVFGDPVVAAAMIDRLVHHADVISLKGDSYRLKDRDLGRTPTDNAT